MMMEKLQQEFYYMQVTLTFEKIPGEFYTVDAKQLKAIILHALQTLHGQVGGSIKVDVLKCMKCRPSTVSSVLRTPYQELVKVWSALTLLGSYGNIPCVFRVCKVSASLMSLAVNSRLFSFDNSSS